MTSLKGSSPWPRVARRRAIGCPRWSADSTDRALTGAPSWIPAKLGFTSSFEADRQSETAGSRNDPQPGLWVLGVLMAVLLHEAAVGVDQSLDVNIGATIFAAFMDDALAQRPLWCEPCHGRGAGPAACTGGVIDEQRSHGRERHRPCA
jgi:hypothetical protein